MRHMNSLYCVCIQRTLEREIRQCQALVIWTDCDREGENIGFEVIDVCKAGECFNVGKKLCSTEFTSSLRLCGLFV